MENIRVLVADDHPLFREGVVQLLDMEEDMECVAMAEDGKEAIRLTQEIRPDVVLMDIEMPNVDGIEATKQIKATCPKTAIVILSAYAYDYYVRACIEVAVD